MTSKEARYLSRLFRRLVTLQDSPPEESYHAILSVVTGDGAHLSFRYPSERALWTALRIVSLLGEWELIQYSRAEEYRGIRPYPRAIHVYPASMGA